MPGKTPNISAPSIVSARDGYDRWSTFYDVDDNPLVLLEESILPQLLGPCAQLDVLDVGCGTGRWASRHVQAGARVTAIDFSPGMLGKAREKSGAQKIRFLIHDLADDLPFVDHAFDRVSCCLVVDHVTNLEKLFREMGRVCRQEGFIVVSTMHPALMLKGTQARFRDPSTGQEIRPQSEPHQISDYIMAITRAGLRIDAMREHAPDEALAERSPRALKYVGWPLLLAFRLRP